MKEFDFFLSLRLQDVQVGPIKFFQDLISRNSILFSSRIRMSNSEKAIVYSTTFFKD